jgi:hypothetical protein
MDQGLGPQIPVQRLKTSVNVDLAVRSGLSRKWRCGLGRGVLPYNAFEGNFRRQILRDRVEPTRSVRGDFDLYSAIYGFPRRIKRRTHLPFLYLFQRLLIQARTWALD